MASEPTQGSWEDPLHEVLSDPAALCARLRKMREAMVELCGGCLRCDGSGFDPHPSRMGQACEACGGEHRWDEEEASDDK